MTDAIKNLANSLYSDTQRRKLLQKDKIIEIVEVLRKILFPDYFEGDKADDKFKLLCEQLQFVQENLSEQILSAFSCEDSAGGVDEASLSEQAQKITEEFLAKIPSIREILKTDVQAAFDGDPAAHSLDEIIIAYPGLLAVSVYRIAHELHLLNVPLLPRIMTEYAHSITGIDIHPGATIGKYFFIDHGTGVVIGETTQIGSHVKIYQGVTLGARSVRKGQSLKGIKRHPTIGDNVTIYSNSTILGGDTIIGDKATIGGNAFIVSSIVEGAKVAAKPPKLQVSGLKEKKKKTE